MHLPSLLDTIEFAGASSPTEALPLKEMSLISHSSSDAYKLSFKLGRQAAHSALHQLGAAKEPILRGLHGEPLWPAGYCGSIAHTASFGCAIAAKQSNHKSLGIDVELSSRTISPEVSKKICHPDELLQYSNLPTTFLIQLFTAKEAVYKCLFADCKVFFGYTDARLSGPIDRDSITIELQRDLSSTLRKGLCIKTFTHTINELMITWCCHPYGALTAH